MNITLKGITKKGKERIKRDGETWKVLRMCNTSLPFAPTDNGPWMFIESEKTKDTRWMRNKDDPDFLVVK